MTNLQTDRVLACALFAGVMLVGAAMVMVGRTLPNNKASSLNRVGCPLLV